MNKYQDNTLVEELEPIILLNDNYAEYGLFKGYIEVVMDNMIEKHGSIVVDFSNPIGLGTIQPVIDIKKEDFRVISGSVADQKLVKAFRDMFKE